MLLSDLNISVEHSALAAYCRDHGVARLSLFGSSLRDEFQPQHSDVDLLVEFSPGVPRSLFKLVRMEDELRQLFGREVDLTTPGSLSKYFREDVISSAVALYDAA